MKQMKTICNIFLFGIILFTVSCGRENEYYAPKPRGYFRIDLPEKEYTRIDTIYPFSFEIPVYARLETDTTGYEGEYWFNVKIPEHKGSIHFSYKVVRENLYEYTEDTHNFVYKHVPKAEDIKVEEIKHAENHVFSLLYQIRGVEAASPTQFYITDSTRHFLRGALYFEHIPNNDSIQPVIDFVNEDIFHLISSLRWK